MTSSFKGGGDEDVADSLSSLDAEVVDRVLAGMTVVVASILCRKRLVYPRAK